MTNLYHKTNIKMFNGKVKFSKFINGKPYFFEREFDNQEEFEKFVKDHQDTLELLPNYDVHNMMEIYDPISIMNQVNRMVDRHLGHHPHKHHHHDHKSQEMVIDKYERELQKIEYQKTEDKQKLEHKEKEIAKKKELINKLMDYKTKFESENRQDLVNQVNEDINKLQKELE